jgi:hypothetical protein
MFGGHVGMTLSAVHRIEPTPVSALVGTDVALEAFRRAVRRNLEVSEVDLMAIVTGIFFLNVRCL